MCKDCPSDPPGESAVILLLVQKICEPGSRAVRATISFFFLISHQFYTHHCIHVNPNCPIQHTTIPTPLQFSPLGVHTFVLYVCVSTSALQPGSSVPFF